MSVQKSGNPELKEMLVVLVVAGLCHMFMASTGTGSVLNSEGEVEMDAVIMDGQSLRTGAVASVHNIANPVSLARLVMDKV